MIGVCKRLSLIVVVVTLWLLCPAFAELEGEGVLPERGTVNSIYNLNVTYVPPSFGKLPDTEPWVTRELVVNRLNTPSPWRENPNYYMLQPDPEQQLTIEDLPAVDVIECEYVVPSGGGDLILEQHALGVKGVWADRWQRRNLLLEGRGDITGHIIPGDAYTNTGARHYFVSYYVAGTSKLRLSKFPLPSQMTVYRIPVEPGWRSIVINPEILKLDPDTAGLKTGGDIKQNIFGLFDNEALKGNDYIANIDPTTGYIAIRGSTPGYTRWMYLAISTHAVDYLEYQGARSLPATYDPDTGEVTLSRPVDVVGDTVRVAYRALGRKSVTLGMTPVTDIRIITSVGMPTDGTNYAANKQFDGATGRVTFNPILPWGTRCLRAEYTAADIENIVPSDTLTYLEGGRPHPIVRPTDDQDQRYTTLQPDPSPSLQYVTVAHPGLYHGVSRIENEIVPYAGQGPGLALALAQGRPNLNGWVLNNEADDSADPPVAASPDYIVTQYPSVWVKEAFIMTADGPEDISNILGVTWLPDAAAPGGGHWVLSIPEDSKLDDSYQGAPIQITYWMPGTAQVLVFGPSPMPATVYPIELNGYSQPKYDQLRVNVNMLFLDEDTEGWRWRAQGLNDSSYNILGVYDRADLTGWNYFDAGRGSVVQDASNAAILKLNMTPAPWINTLYIKVSTYAIDGVFPDTGLGMPDFNDNRYPGAMNTLALADPWNAGLTHAAYNADVVTAWPLPDDDEDTPTEMHLTEIHLARPLDTAGQQVWVSHRVLLPNPAIFGDQPVPPSITPTRGPLMAVPLLSYWDPEANAPVEIQEGLIDQPPVWQAVLNPFDPDNWCPYGTRAFYEIRYHAGMCVSGIYTSATYAYGLGRWGLPNDYQPMYPAGMNVYRAAVSAGVNMSAYRQQPRYDMYDAEDAVMLRDPRLNPVDYAPNLVCNLDASPQTVSWIYVEATSPDVLGEEPDINESGAVSATIHSCNGGYGRHDTPTYGGVLGLDFLTNYPGQNWPVEFVGPDPLIAVPPSPIVPAAMTPDDGAGSTTFDFYVRYWNADNLPPLPWMDQWVDIWGGSTSGVVLFIDSADVLDLGEEHRNHSWRPFFMQPVDLADTDYTDGCDYMYRLQPCASPWVFDPDVTPWPPTPIFCNDYVSLMVGTYHYFFACSDDSLTFEEPDQFLLWYQAIGNVGDPWSDWGNRSPLQRVPFRSSNGLDPHVERYVLDDDLRPWMPRAFGRRYSAFGDDAQDPQDWQLFVDRYSRVPGNFEHGNELIYPWSSVNHPQVTVALQGFSSGRTDGLGRFYGTLQPFYRAVNPAIETPWTEDGFDWMGTRTETCGATKSTTLTFRVKYYQRDNQAPLWVKVFINNESLKVFNYDNGQRPTPENGGYVGYTMQPAEIQTTPGQSQKPPYNYTIGVDYEFKTQLPPGPHTYYFLANDGKQTALYPARPEDWNYPNNPIGEWWLPPNRGDCPFGFDNNYIPGPYVNNPCELSSPSVSPSTGTQGQQFVYRVLYKDKDGVPLEDGDPPVLPNGQRPYQAKIYIDTGTSKGIISADMVKEDPTANDYVNGVWYVFNTATLEDFSLAKGMRRYRFEFIDDWGRPTDLNDVVKGETTYYPASGGWIDGPNIGTQTPPTLRFGKVESTDGTSNGATLWKFSVNYKDLNNDPPKFVTVYIGLLGQDGQSITWDNGNMMQQADPGDVNYQDGCEFIFQTRLHEAANPGDPEPIYYYAFEASDGVALATWVAEDHPDPNARSESAGCLLKDVLTTEDYLTYSALRVPLVGTLQDQPTDAGILIDPMVWMHILGDNTRPVIISRLDEYVCKGIASQGSPKEVARYDAVHAGYLPNITEVIGVYLNEECTGIDYFHDDEGKPGKLEDGTIKLQRELPYGTPWVWIKYRHTKEDYHMVSAEPISETNLQVLRRTTPVNPHTAPEIYEIEAVFDPDGVNVWVGPDGITGTYDHATGQITLPRPLAQYMSCDVKYKMPKYTINRWTGEFTFYKTQRPEDIFLADYFFATRHDSPIGTNQPPSLLNPKLTPMVGGAASDIIYSIEYKETEGPNGQPPAYVRAVIDGVEYNMTPIVQGVPSYRSGVTFRTTRKLSSGAHNYYFVASDGVGQVILPPPDPATGRVTPYLGPWINDGPRLGDGTVDPNPSPGSISTQQPVEYVVTFSDPDNDPPALYTPFAGRSDVSDAIRNLAVPGPILFVDNPTSVWRAGTIAELIEDSAQPGKYRSIRVLGEDGQPANYLADELAGKLLQVMSGNLMGRVYLIANNTSDQIRLIVDNLVDEGVTQDTIFTIAALTMYKSDPSQQNYAAGVQYKLNVPRLLEGQHKYHFEATSVMNPPSWVGLPWSSRTKSDPYRYPGSGELSGPNVSVQPPPTNHEPVLSLNTAQGEVPISPASGKSSDTYDFFIRYRDPDGDPPRYHDGVLGSIRVVFNDGSYAADLMPVVPEDLNNPNFYSTGRLFTVRANGLPEGNHKFHFEASDGWVKARWPEAAQGIDPTINDPEVVVNSKATLTDITITPPHGDTNTVFNISVKYTDVNGDPPQKITVNGQQVDNVWVEFGGSTANKIYLTRDTNYGSNYAAGVVYKGSKAGLTPGSWTTTFKSKDSLGEQTTVVGPVIQVSSNQNACVLSSPKVYNASKPSDINANATGGTTHTYKYEVTYTDADGDMPVIQQNGSTIEGLKLYIDGKLEAIVTVREPSAYLENGMPDYTKPVVYKYTKQGSTFTAGQHSYYFEARDGISPDAHLVRSVETAGPTILAATISLERKTYDAATGTWVDREPRLGEKVRITGVLNESPNKPIEGGQKFHITVAKPDGSSMTLNLTGTTTETTTSKINSFSFDIAESDIMINKTWTITARWDGNSDYTTAVTGDIKLDVKGPTRVLAVSDISDPLSTPVVDMVCMPLTAPNGDAGALFGYDRARSMQIVRWDPEQRTYLWYGDTYFPPLGPGNAVWVLPNSLYPKEALDPNNLPSVVDPATDSINPAREYRLYKPFGRLWQQRTDCEIALKQGWNQIGSPFLSPTALGNAKVKYQGKTVTLDEAAANGWIRNYAWMWDAKTQSADRLIHPTRPDAYKRTIDPWRGYWIRSFVNCTLVLTAPGGTVSALSLSPEEAGPGLVRSSALPALDEPPPAPTGAGK